MTYDDQQQIKKNILDTADDIDYWLYKLSNTAIRIDDFIQKSNEKRQIELTPSGK